MFDIIAFDADDTLWHTESLYTDTEAKVVPLLLPYAPSQIILDVMHANEISNLRYYGYGIKSFLLSLVETACQVSDNRLSSHEIMQIIRWGKEMLTTPVNLFEHAHACLSQLSNTHTLMLITKGDASEQEPKIDKSDLRPYFRYVEILGDKNIGSYSQLFEKYHLVPEHFLMVGNSMRSDIAPVLELGGWAVYIPYHNTWAHEDIQVDPVSKEKFTELEHLGLLPGWLNGLSIPPKNL